MTLASFEQVYAQYYLPLELHLDLVKRLVY